MDRNMLIFYIGLPENILPDFRSHEEISEVTERNITDADRYIRVSASISILYLNDCVPEM